MQYSLALADLNNDSSVSLCKIAWIYNLSWSTLQAHWKERQSAKVFQTGQKQLSVQEKNALIWWIDTMTAWEWPSQIEQLKFMTKHLMMIKGDLNSLEQHWYKNFLHWHSDFKTQYSHNLNQNWKDVENLEIIQKWFDLYNFTQIQHGILKSDIYNMNEKKFEISITDSFKVLVWHMKAQAFSVQIDNQNWVSLIECVSFNDITLSPYFIFKDKLIQQTWLNLIKNGWAVLQVSDNGWTINAIGLHWLKTFDLHTRIHT